LAFKRFTYFYILSTKEKRMKKVQNGLIVFIALVIVASCTKKETTPPSAGQTNAVLLAGAKNATKSWSLVSITEIDNGGSPMTVTATSGIPACESDNVFQFSNNAGQTYVQTEGATLCVAVDPTGDPTTIESGSWAFTDDGNSLFIETTVYPTETQFTNENASGYFLYYFILSVGQPLTVTQITSTSMTLTYSGSFTDSSTNQVVNYVITLVFASKS
jgi:hypothetical protein